MCMYVILYVWLHIHIYLIPAHRFQLASIQLHIWFQLCIHIHLIPAHTYTTDSSYTSIHTFISDSSHYTDTCILTYMSSYSTLSHSFCLRLYWIRVTGQPCLQAAKWPSLFHTSTHLSQTTVLCHSVFTHLQDTAQNWLRVLFLVGCYCLFQATTFHME